MLCSFSFLELKHGSMTLIKKNVGFCAGICKIKISDVEIISETDAKFVFTTIRTHANMLPLYGTPGPDG